MVIYVLLRGGNGHSWNEFLLTYIFRLEIADEVLDCLGKSIKDMRLFGS